MDSRSTDTDQLVTRAAEGDSAAMGELLGRHRERLRRMVAIRMDRRLATRLDPRGLTCPELAKVFHSADAATAHNKASSTADVMARLATNGTDQLTPARFDHQ